MTKRTFTFATLSGLVLLAAAAQTKAPPEAARASVPSATNRGFSELPDGRGGTNVESITYTKEMGFDKARSLKAFQATLYPLLRANCAGCHSTQNTTGSGAQAPLHADADVNVAHEYALTRVNFRQPEDSKLVVRMGIDRHNCFGETCAAAAAQMLQAITAWRDAVADMIPAVPRGVPQSTRITEPQILEWIKADKATTPVADQPFVRSSSTTWMSRSPAPTTSSTGWRGTFPPRRAGSRREVSRMARCPERPESAAETISDPAPPPAPGTITTSSSSTR